MGTNFFDFREQTTTPRRKNAGVRPLAAAAAGGGRDGDRGGDALTITQLTAQIDRTLRTGFPAAVLVRAEVSNFRPNAASGHVYFTLKDAGACVNCVMWRSDAARMKFTPADGMELLARGTVGVYAQQGRYQLYVSSLQPLGQGALELAFQQMRTKLEGEGLFAPERKRPLPRYPTRIVLVTSRQTAALQDMLKVLRRFPWLRLFVYHVPVQGEGCGARIAEGLLHLGRYVADVGGADVVILSRGGGSLEDLWGFNEEAVARAVTACPVPVVTGIGHEVDTSIADLVADYHAHTPTEATQVVTAFWREARGTVDGMSLRVARSVQAMVQHARQRLIGCERHELFRRPLYRVNALRQTLDDRQRLLATATGDRVAMLRRRLETRAVVLLRTPPAVLVARQRERLGTLDRAMSRLLLGRLRRQRATVDAGAVRLAEHHPRNTLALAGQRLQGLGQRLRHEIVLVCRAEGQRLTGLTGHLKAVGPEEVLGRGYSITTRKRDGSIVRSAAGLQTGERIVTRLADGHVESVVDDAKQPRLFE